MRQFFLIMGVVIGLIALPQNIFAHGGEDHMENMQAVGQASEAAVLDSTVEEVGNTICPISGDKVGQMGEIVKYEYNGKVYNLCCKMCMKDFDKDPEKFSKKAEEQAAQEGVDGTHK